MPQRAFQVLIVEDDPVIASVYKRTIAGITGRREQRLRVAPTP